VRRRNSHPGNGISQDTEEDADTWQISCEWICLILYWPAYVESLEEFEWQSLLTYKTDRLRCFLYIFAFTCSYTWWIDCSAVLVASSQSWLSGVTESQLYIYVWSRWGAHRRIFYKQEHFY
jgi:hypothetical protein